MDAIVYGSQQSNSSANGYIIQADLATLEGVQHQGGCMAIVPGAGSGPRHRDDRGSRRCPRRAQPQHRPLPRWPRYRPDLCTDFMVQPATTLPEGASAGAGNIKVAGVAGFAAGQTRDDRQRRRVRNGGHRRCRHSGQHPLQRGDHWWKRRSFPSPPPPALSSASRITIDSGANQESATIALVQGGAAAPA